MLRYIMMLMLMLLFFVNNSSSNIHNISNNSGNISLIPSLSPTLVPTLLPTLERLPDPTFSPNETEHILSVTVRINSMSGATVYYTLDNSIPNKNSLNAMSGEMVSIDTIGNVIVKAYASKSNYLDSNIITKAYKILDICEDPVYSKKAGIYSGILAVTVSTRTPGALIYYTISSEYPGIQPTLQSPHIENNGVITIMKTGLVILRSFAAMNGIANSDIKEVIYTIVPKVVAPVILPSSNTFTTSATLIFHCPTANSTIYYSIDGDNPTENSLKVDEGGSVVVDTVGNHVVKAFATEPTMLASDTTIKVFEILERSSKPSFDPEPSSNLVGDINLTINCPGGTDGLVYYSTDLSTPTLSSDHIECGGSILLAAPGKYTIRAFTFFANKSPSSIVQGEYTLVRPKYDTAQTNSIPFSVQPIVDVFVVEKDLPDRLTYCSKRSIRGRLIVLHNPVGHFDILEPLGGCGRTSLPSVAGRSFKPQIQWNYSEDANVINERSKDTLYSSLFGEASENDISIWNEQYHQVEGLGCQLVTNAGFFNTTTFDCMGDVVTEGKIIQTSLKHNVNFGIRNASFVVGYVEPDEINDLNNPFDTLISGAVWLVRNGKSYVQESMSSSGDHEDMSAQSTGNSFATVLSARTAIGYDSEGRLRILQVEGETWVRGMSLYEFAQFAVDLGFQSAINLDGGGSATMTLNHTLISEPSWACTNLSINANDVNYYRCEKEVSTITCIHAMAPPMMSESQSQQATPPPSTQGRVPIPENPTPFPTIDFDDWPNPSPSKPLWPPSGSKNDDTYDHWKKAYNDNQSGNVTMTSMDAMKVNLQFYKLSTYVLSFILAISLLMHLMSCYSYRKKQKAELRISSNHFDNKPEQIIPKQGKGLEVTHTQRVNDYDIETAGTSVFKLSSPTNSAPSSVRKGVRNDISWQQQLSKINFESDSDSDDDKNIARKKTSKNQKSKGNNVQSVELYSNHFPQIKNTPDVKKKDAAEHKYDPKKSQTKTASSGTVYTILGDDSDEDDNRDNDGDVINPFYNS